MIAPSRQQIVGWWQTLADHQQRYGRCPRCGTRGRCWVRAGAMAELIAHDVYLLGPPVATPAEVSGGDPTDGLLS